MLCQDLGCSTKRTLVLRKLNSGPENRVDHRPCRQAWSVLLAAEGKASASLQCSSSLGWAACSCELAPGCKAAIAGGRDLRVCIAQGCQRIAATLSQVRRGSAALHVVCWQVLRDEQLADDEACLQ